MSEFKQLVRSLHRAGIEVILDVVYNHTGEGGPEGPALSFRGIDNPSYYRLDPNNRSRYVDYTGTGNTLNVRHPQVLKLIMDSLRYWIEEMHVDGFRFDLMGLMGFKTVEMIRAQSVQSIHQNVRDFERRTIRTFEGSFSDADLEVTYYRSDGLDGKVSRLGGEAAAKCYDLEVWSAGVQQWLEVSSCSNFGDFQARIAREAPVREAE